MQSAFLTVGFLFLINPSVFSLDVLPDFIGLFLISKGLFKLSLLSDNMEKARRYVHYLLLFYGVKLMLSFSLFSSPIESNRLLASFVGAVGDWILYTLLVKNFFEGLEALGIRYNGKGMYRGMEVTRVMVQVFFIVRAALDLLPNAVILFFADVDADPGSVEGYGFLRQQYYSVRNWAIVVCAVLTLAFGIYVAYIVFSYRKEVLHDTDFCEKVRADYKVRVLQNETVSLRVSLRRSLTYYTVAPIFLVPLYFEKMDFLPLPFFFLFAFLGERALEGRFPKKKWMDPVLLAGLAVSLGSFGFRVYLLSAAHNFDVAFRSSTPALILDLAAAAFSLYAVFLIVFSAVKTAKRIFSWYPVVNAAVSGALFTGLVVLNVYGDHFTYHEDVFLFLRWAVFAGGLLVFRRWIDSFLSTVDEKLL